MFYTPIHIRFRDLDSLAHVNNAVYHSYVEQARIHYFREVIGHAHNWKIFGVLLARTEIDFKVPILLDDEVKCGCKCISLGNTSMVIEFEFLVERDQNTFIAAKGKSFLVCFDHQAQQKASVPQEWRKSFASYESIEEA